MRLTEYRDPPIGETGIGNGFEDIYIKDITLAKSPTTGYAIRAQMAAALELWRQQRHDCGCAQCLAELSA